MTKRDPPRDAAAQSDFACRLALPVGALDLAVEGVGPITFPITKTTAARLVGVARPAPFGLGEKTLHDRRVRDVWEIAKSRVRIDRRRWNRALEDALETIRHTLGLPPGTLTAPLHKLLVYEKGQFFVPHRDTERADDMVGTLVVVLPSAHRGGTLIVRKGDETRRFAPRRGARPALDLLGFYADCEHEVRPVTEGYRVALSCELRFTPATITAADAGAGNAEEEDAGVIALRDSLERLFASEPASDGSSTRAPEKLVHLLDHRYSERSLSLARLKGADGPRAQALGRAAATLGLTFRLALFESREVWSATPSWHGSPYGHYYRDDEDWVEDEDDEYDEEDVGSDGRGRGASRGLDLHELIDAEITLYGWRDADDRPVEQGGLPVTENELCWFVAPDELEPEFEEYEGYMGNYGETLERHYRRAAVVLWPRRTHYLNLLHSGSRALVTELAAEATAGDVEGARETLRSLIDRWPPRGPIGDGDTLGETLRLLERLDDATLARRVLEGFTLAAVTAARIPALIALGERFGRDFCDALVATWTGVSMSDTDDDDRATYGPRFGERHRYGYRRSVLGWLPLFPRFCRALRGRSTAWEGAPQALFEALFDEMREAHEDDRRHRRPSRREKDAAGVADQLVALLKAAQAIDRAAMWDAVFDHLDAQGHAYLPETLARVAERAGGRRDAPPFARRLAGLRENAVARLRQAVRALERAPGDWRIDADLRCGCADCRTLADFLAASARITLDLPLAKDRRRHLHRQIDGRELPLSHETLRQGRPYVLQLRKRETLFARDGRRRRALGKRLERLEAERL